MPNHCQNTLLIVGSPKDLKKFLGACKNPNFGKRRKNETGRRQRDGREWTIFEGNFPCPTELVATEAAFYADEKLQRELVKIEKANLKKYGFRNWYDWCNDNWGTKWGDYDTHIDDEYKRDKARFEFVTAWAPGTEGLKRISALHPELAFVNSYEEEGCNFIGCDAFYRGKIISGGSSKFPRSPSNWDDDDKVEAYLTKVSAIHEKLLKKAVSKLEKKSPFHAKKLKSLVKQ